jgi:hypothetical protein
MDINIILNKHITGTNNNKNINNEIEMLTASEFKLFF